MLGPISAVTITVPALEVIEDAYTAYLGMRVWARGVVPPAAAAGWDADRVAGCRYIVLVPETGEETCLRFIEDAAAGTCAAFTTHGWNATELTVQNTDFLAARLENSPFRIIGPPANLKGFDWIRAMQVLGPAGECLYFTDVSTDPALARARAMVGQVFIVVAAGPDIDAMSGFYRAHFPNVIAPPVAVPIGVVNRANNLPAATCHKLALVELPGGTRIELDEYPPIAVARPVRPGHLPPGVGIVSFATSALSGAGGYCSEMPPFCGKQTVCLSGAAGELIELCA